jgi:putative membrane protein
MPLFAYDWRWDEFGMALFATAAFGLLGIVLLALGYKVFDWITPKLDVEQKLQEGNVAVGVAVGALLIAIAVVVFAAIHG